MNDYLIKRPVSKVFFHYLIPAICATMVTSIYVLADTIIIGKFLGSTAMAALNIVLPVFNVFFGMGLLFGVGGSVLMSVFRGGGDFENANRYFTAALILNIAVCILLLVFSVVFMEDIAVFLGATEETEPYIMDYLPYIVWGIGVFFMSSFLQTFVRNDGAPRLAMAAVIAGGVTNIILDIVFVSPLGMGMSGAALATVIGTSLTVLILIAHFFTKKNGLRLNFKGIKPAHLKNITVSGFASFLIEITEGIVILIFNAQLLKYIGNAGVTVYGIISNTVIVVMCLTKGVSQAAQPVISNNYGAGLIGRAKKAQSLAVKTAAIICCAVSLIGLIAPNLFTYIFLNPDEQILAIAPTAIRLYFVSMIFLGINMVYISYFQSVISPGKSLLICMTRGFILSVLFVEILPLFMGELGIWLAMPLTEIITSVMVAFLVRGEKLSNAEPKERLEDD